MNRSQVMRLALTGAVKELHRQQGLPAEEKPSETHWVSRAHGAVSGCDAHSAYQDLDEMNFFGYLFDEGTMFADGYNPATDDDPQQGPLQRGFIETFGETKQPRIGEEMARELKLNPTSEYTTEREFEQIGKDREYTHLWFDKWVFAPMERIVAEPPDQEGAPTADQLTLPPPDATRRIFFAFARAVPGIVQRLLEAHGAHNSVVVSLQYDDIMNHELRHCAGKTVAELEAKMREVHLKAYNMYASLLHADTSPGPEQQPAPEPEPEQQMEVEMEPALPGIAGGAAGGAAGEQDSLTEMLTQLGISDDIAQHLAVSTYVSMTQKGNRTRDRLGYDVDERFRLLSPDPIAQPDGVQYYEVQSPFVKGQRGLVPIAHCSAPFDGGMLSAFAFELVEAGHFPKKKQKQRFFAWALGQGIEEVIAESTLVREVKYGGTLTGVPVEDAMAHLEQDLREQRGAARAPPRLDPVATPPPRPPVAAPLAAGECTPVRYEEVKWKVLGDRAGEVVPGGPGTRVELDASVGPVLFNIPPDAPRRSTVKFTIEINTETNSFVRLAGVEYERVVEYE